MFYFNYILFAILFCARVFSGKMLKLKIRWTHAKMCGTFFVLLSPYSILEKLQKFSFHLYILFLPLSPFFE